ncbi:MAG: hypothetical protein ACT4NY_09165 [Pseudonocardiales bacterium]
MQTLAPGHHPDEPLFDVWQWNCKQNRWKIVNSGPREPMENFRQRVLDIRNSAASSAPLGENEILLLPIGTEPPENPPVIEWGDERA